MLHNGVIEVFAVKPRQFKLVEFVTTTKEVRGRSIEDAITSLDLGTVSYVSYLSEENIDVIRVQLLDPSVRLPAKLILFMVRYGQQHLFKFDGKIGTLRQMEDAYSFQWLHSAQKGLYVQWDQDYNRRLPFVSSVTEKVELPFEKKIEKRPVYLEVKGPTLAEIRCLRGKGTGPAVSYDGVEFLFVTEPLLPEEVIEVPPTVRADFLRQYVNYQQTWGAKLSDASYYAASLEPYSVWSFPVHARQVQAVLEVVPLDAVVVAPCDGVGLISRCWKGTVVSGDLVSTPMTSEKTKTETAMETLKRAERYVGEKVYIMAYTWAFLGQEEKDFLAKTASPVFFLEPTDHMVKIPGVRLYGPGLFGLNIPEGMRPYMNATERWAASKRSVLFSENLLQLTSVCVHSYSSYLEYLIAMRPSIGVFFAEDYQGPRPFCNEIRTGPYTHLLTSMDEVTTFFNLCPDSAAYVAVTGTIHRLPVVVALKMDTHELNLFSRTLYVTYNTEENRAILTTVPNHAAGSRLYFYCTSERQVFTISFRTSLSLIVGRICFAPMSRERLPTLELSIKREEVWVNYAGSELRCPHVGGEIDVRAICRIFPSCPSENQRQILDSLLSARVYANLATLSPDAWYHFLDHPCPHHLSPCECSPVGRVPLRATIAEAHVSEGDNTCRVRQLGDPTSKVAVSVRSVRKRGSDDVAYGTVSPVFLSDPPLKGSMLVPQSSDVVKAAPLASSSFKRRKKK
jgi:hypothetical protein